MLIGKRDVSKLAMLEFLHETALENLHMYS